MTPQQIFARESALILAELISYYPGLLDGSEVDSADLVDSLTQHLFFNLSPESKDLIASHLSAPSLV